MKEFVKEFVKVFGIIFLFNGWALLFIIPGIGWLVGIVYVVIMLCLALAATWKLGKLNA